MLHHLSIRDFVIVAELDLEFESGFTVFSGETGAGKSILLDALALVLGARAEASMVRHGQTRAEISASFTMPEALRAWFIEQELLTTDTAGESETLILRRTIDVQGRSRAFINGSLSTLGQLREIGEQLVDIHGQHAHQQLMRADAQRTLFDLYAGIAPLAAEVKQAWSSWRAANATLHAAQDQEHSLQLEREQLAWKLNELETLAAQPGEWEELGTEHQRAAHAADLIDNTQQALRALSEEDDALLTRLSTVLAAVRKSAAIDSGLTDTLSELEAAQIQLQEATHSLNHYVQRLELDPARLAQIEARLADFHTLARKFRLAPEALHTEVNNCQAQLDALDATLDVPALQKIEAKAQQNYQALAQRLSQQRNNATPALGQAVTAHMQSLAMAGGSFEVALIALPEGSAHGLEQIEFQVAGHPGVPVRPLTKIASGGELARIGLALAVVASAASLTPSLIFDEVDSGIGGAAAEAVGRLLRQLGEHRQVLCVTHLPQVAARGMQHLGITKQTSAAGQPISIVTQLNAEQRIEEIARMLGGAQITATTRQHAKELLAG